MNLNENREFEIDNFLKSNKDGLYYIGHASVLIKLNKTVILCDPVFSEPPHFGMWIFFPKMSFSKKLYKVDYIFISHQHLDHYDKGFLKEISKNTKIIILPGRPHFELSLKEEKIDFQLLNVDLKSNLNNDVSYFGTLHEYNEIDSSIVFANENISVYHGNDCYLSNKKLRLIYKAFPEITIALVPFAYIHWYPFLLIDVDEVWKKKESLRLINKYLEIGISQIKTLKPKYVIPFGANMFYYNAPDSDHNKSVVSLFDFIDYVKQNNPSLQKKILPFFSGDIIYEDKLIKNNTFTKTTLYSSFNKYINELKSSGGPVDLNYINSIKVKKNHPIKFIEKRLLKHKVCINHFVYIYNKKHLIDLCIEINLKTNNIEIIPINSVKKPFHFFEITDLAFKAYFYKNCSFNEIVASSLFLLKRLPNKYSLDVLKVINNVL